MKRRRGPLAYELILPDRFKIHPVISVIHLLPASKDKDPYGRGVELVKLVEVDGEDGEQWEVDAIIKSETDAKVRKKYLVHWKGFGHEYDELSKTAPDLVAECAMKMRQKIRRQESVRKL